jgi:hypothetical protein
LWITNVVGPVVIEYSEPPCIFKLTHVIFEHVFERVDGIGVTDIAASPQPPVEFGPYLPQVAWDSGLRPERVAPPHVGVRIDEVMRYGRVRSAAELRSHLGLKPSTRVTLLLFAHDVELEAFADGGQAYLDQIAAGRYCAVTAPSYSLWMPRRRPDNLLSLRPVDVDVRGPAGPAELRCCPVWAGSSGSTCFGSPNGSTPTAMSNT